MWHASRPLLPTTRAPCSAFTPEIFSRLRPPGSAGQISSDGKDLLAASRFEALERYIVATLDQHERVRLKLLNPLGVGAHLVDKYRELIDERLDC